MGLPITADIRLCFAPPKFGKAELHMSTNHYIKSSHRKRDVAMKKGTPMANFIFLMATILMRIRGLFRNKKGEVLFRIYAEKEWKLDKAIEIAMREPPIVVSGMILEKYPSYRLV